MLTLADIRAPNVPISQSLNWPSYIEPYLLNLTETAILCISYPILCAFECFPVCSCLSKKHVISYNFMYNTSRLNFTDISRCLEHMQNVLLFVLKHSVLNELTYNQYCIVKSRHISVYFTGQEIYMQLKGLAGMRG